MRTFSAGFTLAKNKKENAPVNLLEIAWPARPLFPAKTIRLADRPFTIDGTNWLALVEDWGGLDNFPDRGEGGGASPPGVSTFRINLLNVSTELGDGTERFSDFLRRYPPEAATVTLYQWFDNEGLNSSDITELIVGRVIDPIEYDERFCSFHVELGFRSYGATMLGNVLSSSNYPNAPDESIGKVLPVVIGNVEKVPGIALRKVERTRITSVVLPGAVSIDVGSTSGFPSSGTLVVNDDEVTYTGVTATQFTGCSGINEFHYSGDEALEKVVAHNYLFSDPAWLIKSIGNVRVDGEVVPSSDYTVDIAAGEVVFTKKPRRVRSMDTKFLQAQFDAEASGNTAVDPLNAIDPDSRTSYARINQVNNQLALKQTSAMPDIGKIGKVLLRVEHFVEEKLPNDSLTAEVVGSGQVDPLSSPSIDDKSLTVGTVDASHATLDTFEFPINNPVHDHSPTSDSDHILEQASISGSGDKLKLYRQSTFNSPKQIQFNFDSIPSGSLKMEYSFSLTITDHFQWGSVTPDLLYGGVIIAHLVTATLAVPAHFEFFPGFTTTGVTNTLTVTDNIDLLNFSIHVSRRVYYDHNNLNAIQQLATIKAGQNETVSLTPALDGTTDKSTMTVVDHFDITSQVNGDWSWFLNKEIRIKYNGSLDGRTAFIIHTAFEIEYARQRLAATDNISADVEGIVDDASGTLTGTANALIERPDHVFKWSLMTVLGQGPSALDTGSFDSAGTSLAAVVPGGYRFGGVVQTKTSLFNLWRRWMKESRTRLFWDAIGKARLQFHPLNVSSSVSGQEVKTISEQNFLRDGFKIRRTPAENLINHIDLKYSRDWKTNSYDKLFTTSDTGSISFFGRKEQPQRFEFDWVRDDNQAQDLAAWFLAERGRPNTLVQCAAFLDQVELEPGDIILFTHPLENLDQALGIVLSGGYELGSGKKKKMDNVKLLFRLFPPEFYIVPGGYGVQAYGTSGYGGRIPL